MNLLNFITKNEPLNDKQNIVLKTFIEKYKYQNGGILDEDIIKWVQLLTGKKPLYKQLKSSLIEEPQTDKTISLLVSIQEKHLYAEYITNGVIERYDTSFWQHTTNNCSLYAGIALIIRPLLNSMSETIEVLKLLDDTKNSESAIKLAKISKYYFARDIEWFHYRKVNEVKLIKLKQIDNPRTLYLYFYGLNCVINADTTTQPFKDLKKGDFRIYIRSNGTPKMELSNFINYYNYVRHEYNKFVLIGHSYGNAFAHTFAEYLFNNDKEVKVLAISLDGANLKDFVEKAATKLNLDPKKAEIYDNTAICEGVDIIKEKEKRFKRSTIENLGTYLTEVTMLEGYKVVKEIHDANFKVPQLKFIYKANPENPEKVNITKVDLNTFSVSYLDEYDHFMHQYKIVSEEIIKIIDDSFN